MSDSKQMWLLKKKKRKRLAFLVGINEQALYLFSPWQHHVAQLQNDTFFVGRYGLNCPPIFIC